MIDVEDLEFTYPGADGPVLKGIGFAVARGEVFGLLGPSGAGKSTTQAILMGLLKGHRGTAHVFGRPVGDGGGAFYEKIGVSFELPSLYLRLTALENLRLFAALYDRRTRDPMEVLGLVDLQDAAGQRVEHFSKGMKMRLNLARALLHDPELLFLDEPTTGQDPARARRTRELIKQLRNEGRTVFLTTHNMAEAEEVCDRVAFLARGTIPAMGVPAELKRAYGQSIVEVSIAAARGIEIVSFPMQNLGANGAFMELMATGSVVAIHSKEASLDDVFIAVTEGSGSKAA
ncbi:MAG: ABC transporter ATP-binding protein [Alphaproteobacteria bacterium]|nr:ABC transporter ATP-binding protein [Alphaproteobacteria bacterium]